MPNISDAKVRLSDPKQASHTINVPNDKTKLAEQKEAPHPTNDQIDYRAELLQVNRNPSPETHDIKVDHTKALHQAARELVISNLSPDGRIQLSSLPNSKRHEAYRDKVIEQRTHDAELDARSECWRKLPRSKQDAIKKEIEKSQYGPLVSSFEASVIELLRSRTKELPEQHKLFEPLSPLNTENLKQLKQAKISELTSLEYTDTLRNVLEGIQIELKSSEPWRGFGLINIDRQHQALLEAKIACITMLDLASQSSLSLLELRAAQVKLNKSIGRLLDADR